MPIDDGSAGLAGPDERQPLAVQLEELLLGGRRRHTRAQAAELAGIPLEQASQLWHALGFASVGDDELAFTDDDVTALANVATLVAAQLIDAGSLRSVTRMVGQSMARLADWQGRLLLELLTERPELLAPARPGDEEPAGPAQPDARELSANLAAFVGSVQPALEQLQAHVWRRQLAAVAGRLLGGAEGNAGGDPQSAAVAVGFADLAGYTSLSRQIGVGELSAVLEEFEALAADLVAEHRGQVIKTIGDEVLFVTGKAVAAAEIALELQRRAGQRLPPLRIGLAYGSVLARFGDVYGPVVNLASRLTGLARVGTVLIDQQLAAELAGDARFELRRLRPASVRGYHHLSPVRLRAANG